MQSSKCVGQCKTFLEDCGESANYTMVDILPLLKLCRQTRWATSRRKSAGTSVMRGLSPSEYKIAFTFVGSYAFDLNLLREVQEQPAAQTTCAGGRDGSRRHAP